MKLIIFSDSHGSTKGMVHALSLHPDADAVIHLGDGAREFALMHECYPSLPFITLMGNTDEWQTQVGAPPQKELLTEFGGLKFLLCHGHRYSVKSGCERYLAYAAAKGAKIAMFGHTHEPLERYCSDEEIWLFNPGSISRPVYGAPSYGIVEIRRGAPLFSHGSL